MTAYYGEVLEVVVEQRQLLAEQESRLATVNGYHAQQRAHVEAALAQAGVDLGGALLPAFDTPSIARAAALVGLAGLPAEDLPGQVQARRQWLEHRLRAIAGDPRFTQRELRRHPNTGSLTCAIREATEQRQLLVPTLEAFRSHDRYERLLEVGFGTGDYQDSWWRYSCWLDHSAAREILKAFPPGTDFAQARERYLEACNTVATFNGELHQLQAELAADEALEREYGVLYAEHAGQYAAALQSTRNRLLQHLMTAEPAAITQRLEAVRDLQLLFLRASGLYHKLGYLDGVYRANAREIRQDLTTRKQKLDGVEQRARRGRPMPRDKLRKLAEDPRPRFEKRWARFGKVYETVQGFDRYNQARVFEQFLWWDLMTRGRYDGRFLPDVDLFYRRNRNYQYDPAGYAAAKERYDQRRQSSLDVEEPDDDSFAAAAIALASLGGGGTDSSGADGSDSNDRDEDIS